MLVSLKKGLERVDFKTLMETGEDRVVGCPNCEQDRTMETDANYIFTCEGCGQQVRVYDIMAGLF